MVVKELIQHEVVPVCEQEPQLRGGYHWYHSITGKVAIYLMLGVLIAYGIGSGAGVFEVNRISHEQWYKQAATNSQITSYIIRNIYTSTTVKSNHEGQVVSIESERPLSDDETIIQTGFNPADMLTLVSTQTHNPTWLLLYDKKHGFTDLNNTDDISQKITTATDTANQISVNGLLSRLRGYWRQRVFRRFDSYRRPLRKVTRCRSKQYRRTGRAICHPQCTAEKYATDADFNPRHYGCGGQLAGA
ncbi:hypothetical protein ACSPAH_09050 [Buttiauxella agrestis]